MITSTIPSFYKCQDWKPPWNGLRTCANPRASFSTKIATYRNGYPFRLIHGCLLLVLQSLTQAYAVLCTAICCPADVYSKPSGLHGFLSCYSLSCTVAYSCVCGCLFLQVYIRCLPTNNAVAYSALRINQCYRLRAPQLFFSFTSYIKPQRLYSPALRPSLLDKTDSIRSFSIALPLYYLGPKVYLKTLTLFIRSFFFKTMFRPIKKAYIEEETRHWILITRTTIYKTFILSLKYPSIYIKKRAM